MEPVVTIKEINKQPDNYNYVVIAAFFQGKWLWVKHKDRDTWELPAGHVETNETPGVAAIRELYEETGTLNYQLNPICDFTISNKGQTSNNRLYLANIHELGTLPKSEIAEVAQFENIPENLTYSSIQKILFEEAAKNIKITIEKPSSGN